MARIARFIAPGIPHHVTQRGNRRQQTFFCDDDYRACLALMAEWCHKCWVKIWAWCLMPNHVHLIAVPASENSLVRAIGEAHRRYTRRINVREGWHGLLWQERFASFPMDLTHLFAATRYVEMSPVAALVERPEDYPWSSARAPLSGAGGPLVKGAPLSKMVGNWWEFLTLTDEEELNLLKRHERSGRPLGGAAFVHRVETELARILRPLKRGPKPKTG